MILIIGLFFLTFSMSESSTLTSSRFKVCARNLENLSDCVNEAAAIAIKELAKGYKDLDIQALEPLAVDKFSIGSTKYLKQQYENVKLHGLTKSLKITDYKLDFENLIFKSTAFNPQVDFVGNYKLDGKLLILPIRGNGRCNITMKNLITKSEFHGEKFIKDGKEYMKIKKYIINFIPKKVFMDFTNLFDGNLLLAAPASYFINENADLLFQELQEPFEKSFAKLFMKIANSAFTKIPLNVIFPET